MNKNSCPHKEKVLELRLGLLNAAEAQEFEAHLDKCSVCQHELQLESIVEEELSKEMDPGFIEESIRARIRMQKDYGMRSFWLYALRMAAYGIVAAVISVTIIPFLVRYLSEEHINIANTTTSLSGWSVQFLAYLNEPLFVVSLGFILLIASSVYSFVYSR